MWTLWQVCQYKMDNSLGANTSSCIWFCPCYASTKHGLVMMGRDKTPTIFEHLLPTRYSARQFTNMPFGLPNETSWVSSFCRCRLWGSERIRHFEPKWVSSKPEFLSPDHAAARDMCFEHFSRKGDVALSDLSAVSLPSCLWERRAVRSKVSSQLQD